MEQEDQEKKIFMARSSPKTYRRHSCQESNERIQRPVKKPRGKPKTTWMSLIQKELKQLNLTLMSATEKVMDRTVWNEVIEGAMSTN